MTTLPETLGKHGFRPLFLAWFLRGLGLIDLVALLAVFLPTEWIAWSHQSTGMGNLPEERIVGYLVRSTSALYALHGALLLFLAFDVVRYRPLIQFLGWLTVMHGIILLFVDVRVGMPPWWQWTEGPTFSAIGLAIVILSRRNRQPHGQDF